MRPLHDNIDEGLRGPVFMELLMFLKHVEKVLHFEHKGKSECADDE